MPNFFEMVAEMERQAERRPIDEMEEGPTGRGAHDPLPGHHEHCLACFTSSCQGSKTKYACSMIECIKCKISLHACKLQEHWEEICPDHSVPCLNAGNGCSLLLRRRLLGVHLERCPASVVFCSVEWNRWPLHYVDKHSPIPFFLPNPQGYPEQLDIALALRDQTMLNAAYEAPKRFRRLRNELTERFPAVPLPTLRQVPAALLKEREQLASVPSNGSHLSRDVSVDSDSQSNAASEEDISWSDSPWQKRRNPPGLSRSLCSKLYQASRQTTESLKAALQMITEGHDGMGDFDSLRDEESLGDNLMDDQEDNLADSMQSALGNFATDFPPSRNSDNEMSEIDFEKHEYEQMVTGDLNNRALPPPPPPPLHAPISLGVNVVVETITRYQTKPKSMLTFVCGQSFRRSEYGSHYKNVHSEIQGGLTWMEQRCPLAQYGCPFSLRRINPATPGASIMHSSDLQSFAVRQTQKGLPNYSGEDLLSRLPDELLYRIGTKLDGFALNNLARTSRRLRGAALNLLEEKGMVLQEWSKVGRGKWRIEFQRWMYSTAFDEVEAWKMAGGTTGEHLRQCPFFRSVRHEKPVELPIPSVKNVSEELLARMYRGAAVPFSEKVELVELAAGFPHHANAEMSNAEQE
ncbi:hypothetical protein RvY_01505 [Ramazzottius varieornatus]|uniref:F-box domain-containing protein n=1 Tax=Ramazzottius varieornatus TaxID=947166 RepID=A0A1D1UNN5_RAMVA|nr:hypothetical protein RvY_01505 [Ramazzottius varieornatus]